MARTIATAFVSLAILVSRTHEDSSVCERQCMLYARAERLHVFFAV